MTPPLRYQLFAGCLMVQIYGQKILGIHFISPLHVGARSALLRFIFLSAVSKQTSRLLSCSSFSAKGLTRPQKVTFASDSACKLAAKGRLPFYKLFAAAPAGADLFLSHLHVGTSYSCSDFS